MSHDFDTELFNFIASRDGSNHTAIALEFAAWQGQLCSALDRLEANARIYWDAVDGYKRK